MPELLLGALAGVWLAARVGIDGPGATVAAVLVALVAYLVSCWGWPRRKCWRCSGARERSDGRGNLRDRNCRVCAGSGRRRRFGAVLTGRGAR